MKPADDAFVLRTLMALREANWMATRQELLDASRNSDDALTLGIAKHAREALAKNGFRLFN